MWDLDPSVAAAYGLPPSDPTMPADSSTPDFGLHPAVAAAYGWPAPVVPALPPPPVAGATGDTAAQPPGTPPTTLPSMAAPTPAPAGPAGAQTAPGKVDYPVPPSAFGPKPTPKPTPKPAAPGKPPTPQQLEVDARARQDAADRQAAGAIGAQQDVATATAQQNLVDFSRHAEAAKQIEDQRKALADDITKTHAQKQAYVDQTMREVDDYKVDQNKFVHDMGIGDMVGWGIATALSSVGQALQHQTGPNPVVQMLQEKMHQAVVAQMEQREQLKEKNARAEHSLDKFDAFSKDRQAQMDMLDARNDRWLAQQVALTGAKMADPAARATAQQQYAALMESSADKAKKAADTATTNDIQYKHVAIAQSANAIAGGHLAVAQQAERRAQKLQDLEWGPGGIKEQELGIKAAAELRKSMEEKKKTIADQGIFNPTNAQPLLNAQGKAMVAQADQLEAVARKNPAQAAQAYVDYLKGQATTEAGKAQVAQIEAQVKSNPAVAQQIAQGYADKLRQDARTTQVATISDKEDRRAVMDTIEHGQKLYNALTAVRDFLAKDPSITDREGWGELQAKYGTAIAEEAKSLGANASSREFDALSKHILTFDPSSLYDRAARKGPALAAVEALMPAVKQGVDIKLKGRGIEDGWTPSTPGESPAATFGGQTAQEVGEAAKPGLIHQYLVNPIAHPVATAQGDLTPEKIQTGAENEARAGSNYGLAPKDESKATALISEAESASNAKRKQIVDSLAAPIVKNDRPSLSWGLLRMVHDQDPAMFEDILKEVGTERAKEIRRYIPPTSVVPLPPGLPPVTTKPSGFDPDEAARAAAHAAAERERADEEERAARQEWAKEQGLSIGGPIADPYPLRGLR